MNPDLKACVVGVLALTALRVRGIGMYPSVVRPDLAVPPLELRFFRGNRGPI